MIDRTTGSPLKRIGWTLLAVGAVLALACTILGAVTVGPAFARSIGASAYPTPLDRTFTLDKGNYEIFENTRGLDEISPEQVTVTAPDGRAVTVTATTLNETITRNSDSYTAVLKFRTPSHGRYRVQIANDGDTSVLVSRSLGALALRTLGWILGAGLGVLILAVGVVLLIVNAARGRKIVSYPPPTGAGWYPDPSAPGGSRWQNGPSG